MTGLTLSTEQLAFSRARLDDFPGGMLPTKAAVREAALAAGFTLGGEEAFGVDLAQMARALPGRVRDVSALGLDDRFRRMWEYYLAYCEAGFRCESVDVSLIQLEG